MTSHSQFAKHLKFQSGCYLDMTIRENEIFYVRSSRITDLGWNYIYSPNVHVAAEAAKSRPHGLDSVFFSSAHDRQALLLNFPNAEVHLETWLQTKDKLNDEGKDVFEKIHISRDPVPNDDFLKVFSNILQDLGASVESISSFDAQYLNSLRGAKAVETCSVRHIVGYAGDAPTACASVYFDGDFGCIYNVGTISGRKNLGFGSAVSVIAANVAFDSGASCVFLQCEYGGYVEKMYRGIGFADVSDQTGFLVLR